MEKDLISIIVPVYNVKDYINECVKSICEQTYKNLEIILVDDGSTDGSAEICDNFSKFDKRIKVIHKQNAGPSSAREAGVKAANGNYIGFIDADDYIDKNMYYELFNAIQKNNSDVSVCGFNYLHPQYDNSINFNNKNFSLPGKETIIKTYFEMPYMASLWNKLYKKEIINYLDYPKGYYEDLASLFLVYCKANKISFINKPLYFYRNRKDSTQESFWTKDTFVKIKDTINALIKMAEYPDLIEYKQHFLYGKIWDYSAEFFIYLSNLNLKDKDEILNYIFNVLYTKCSSKFINNVDMYTYIWRFLFAIKNIDKKIHQKCVEYLKKEIICNCNNYNLSKFQKLKLSLYIKFPFLIKFS